MKQNTILAVALLLTGTDAKTMFHKKFNDLQLISLWNEDLKGIAVEKETKDNIELATNEDMYAFSQIVASGGNVMKVSKEIEDEETKVAKEKKEKMQENMWLQAAKVDTDAAAVLLGKTAA